jgi:hypothetical protein
MNTPKIAYTVTKLNMVHFKAQYPIHCISYYVNDLSYIINNLSKPLNLFCSLMTLVLYFLPDYATEFIVTFDKIHLRFAINSLLLNFNKINYVHFT